MQLLHQFPASLAPHKGEAACTPDKIPAGSRIGFVTVNGIERCMMKNPMALFSTIFTSLH
ncbi:MAG: hypothetical protein WCH01_22645 [Methylococcaceae bacterium]